MIELWNEIPPWFQLTIFFCACCWAFTIVYLIKAEIWAWRTRKLLKEMKR